MGEQVAAGTIQKIKPTGFYIQQHHLQRCSDTLVLPVIQVRDIFPSLDD